MKRDKSGNILLLPSEKAPVLEKMHKALPALGVTELPDMLEYIGNVDGREYYIGAIVESRYGILPEYVQRGSHAITRCILSSDPEKIGLRGIERDYEAVRGNVFGPRGSSIYGSHIKGSEIRIKTRGCKNLPIFSQGYAELSSDIEDAQMILKGIDFLSKNEVMQEQRKEAENFFRNAEFRKS